MSDTPVLVAHHGAVRLLTLNRPAALNSFTAAMHGVLRAAPEEAPRGASMRAVLITGNGRGFCAGQDLSGPAMSGKPDVGAVIEACYRPLAARVRTMPVPVVAAMPTRALDAAAPMDFADAINLEADAQRELGRADDFAEGVAAFSPSGPPSSRTADT